MSVKEESQRLRVLLGGVGEQIYKLWSHKRFSTGVKILL
jgi:hypothetical protein